MKPNIKLPFILFFCWVIFSLATTKIEAQTIQSIDSTGIVYISNNEGVWKNISNGLPNNIHIGLGGITSSNNLLSIATKEEGIYIYQEQKNIWVQLPTHAHIIEGMIGPIIYFKNGYYIGTQKKGVYHTDDKGKIWETVNANLKDYTIRRLVAIEGKLYACTNSGVYELNEKLKSWKQLFSETGLQVNGITSFKNSLYIATNKGVFKNDGLGNWQNVLPNNSVHNISADSIQIHAMTYTSLLLHSTDGINWQKAQSGLPQNLYTFNVISHQGKLFAGQWDGVYTKTKSATTWTKWSKGLPVKFAATNLLTYKNQLVITTSERKLK